MFQIWKVDCFFYFLRTARRAEIHLGLGVLKNKDWLFYVEPDTTLRLLEIWLIKDFMHQTKNSYIYNIY